MAISTADLVQQRLYQALAMHKAGREADAERYYEQIIALQPNHSDALQLLGVIRVGSGRAERGVELIQRALALNPSHAAGHSNLGNGLVALRRHQEAITSYQTAIKLDPRLAEAHQGLGNALMELGRHAEALDCFDRVLGIDPAAPEAHARRARIFQVLKKLPEALQNFDRAIVIDPDQAELYLDRGVVLYDLGRFEEARQSYESALRLKPALYEARSNLAITLKELGQPLEAMQQIDLALQQNPSFAGALLNRGALLQDQQRFTEALAAFDAALALRPDFAPALNNRGGVLHEMRRYAEARECFGQAIALDAGVPGFHCNLAKLASDLRCYEAALAHCDRAIALQDGFVDARFGKATLLLQMGRMREGWQEYEWRKKFENSTSNRVYPQPLWQGEAGGTLFVYWEQGLGDSIQCCRFLPQAKARCDHVIFAVQDPLLPLMRQFEPAIQVVPGNASPTVCDWQIPLMSLPKVLGNTLDTIPAAEGYFSIDPERLAHFEALLGPRTRPRVGLAWRGNAIHKNDRRRSMDFNEVRPLLRDDVEYFCLQPLLPDHDMAALQADGRVRFIRGALMDFADTAALMGVMDLVISVDTSVAHLAGALGKTVWVMLPYNPDWRWLLERPDSPWYHSMRLFRQNDPYGWVDAVEKVARALKRDRLRLHNTKA